jgi:hypothetical protein
MKSRTAQYPWLRNQVQGGTDTINHECKRELYGMQYLTNSGVCALLERCHEEWNRVWHGRDRRTEPGQDLCKNTGLRFGSVDVRAVYTGDNARNRESHRQSLPSHTVFASTMMSDTSPPVATTASTASATPSRASPCRNEMVAVRSHTAMEKCCTNIHQCNKELHTLPTSTHNIGSSQSPRSVEHELTRQGICTKRNVVLLLEEVTTHSHCQERCKQPTVACGTRVSQGVIRKKRLVKSRS